MVQDLVDTGPFEAVLAAADAAQDQLVLGNVLAAQGRGTSCPRWLCGQVWSYHPV